MPILHAVQTPERPAPERRPPLAGPPPAFGRRGEVLLAAGDRLAWVGGLVLSLSAFMSWYAGSGEGPTLGVSGWHTGTLGKLVFFVGLAVLLVVALREAGVELPAAVPEPLVLIALGALGTIFVVIRIISIPETFYPNDGRGIGIWIGLAAEITVIVAGLLRASEEL